MNKAAMWKANRWLVSLSEMKAFDIKLFKHARNHFLIFKLNRELAMFFILKAAFLFLKVFL